MYCKLTTIYAGWVVAGANRDMRSCKQDSSCSIKEISISLFVVDWCSFTSWLWGDKL